jgi:UDP-N-acetylmuramoyl-L-alanyl-D-glutamate--2,6-diaminopimelate ligase
MANLSALIDGCRNLSTEGGMEAVISGISTDSRSVELGHLFAALPGSVTDGIAYVDDAIDRGARAILLHKKHTRIFPENVAVLRTDNPRIALAYISSKLFRSPSQHFKLAGITGTNGKTTITHLTHDILTGCGIACGTVGTLGYTLNSDVIPTASTTPEAPDLQSIFFKFWHAELSHAVMEVSSHALAWHRVDEVDFDVACFTNLTQDHLDFHGTMEAYLDAKCSLFRSLSSGLGKAVINIDDPAAGKVLAAVPPGCSVIRYGITKATDVCADKIQVEAFGSRFHLLSPWVDGVVSLPIPGHHNILNALAAFSVSCMLGAPPKRALDGLNKMGSVPGRMERIDCGQQFLVVVDYAHTPDALKNLLTSLRSVTSGNLITVFGCGGDRDRLKRPLMAQAVTELSDLTIITSDNPRTEEPEQIIEDAVAGILPGKSYHCIVNRADAIKTAIQKAEKNDIVVIAGKGHENYQIIGRETISFDDRIAAREALRQIGYKS